MTIDLDAINTTAQELLACVCTELYDTPGGCPARLCLVPGAEVSIENCCDGPNGGQLSINIGRMYPSRQFPIPDTGERNCDAPLTIVDFYISIFRCAPMGGTRAATCDALTAAYEVMVSDMRAIRTGIECCLNTEAHRKNRFAYGDHLSYGPEGNCTGSTLLVAVSFLNCRGC